MSSLAVNAITDASGGTTASINGHTPTASNMAGKNRIINGAMMIDQRNAGAAVTSASTYTLDRWETTASGSAFTAQQNAGSVTPPAGFTNYLGVTVTTTSSAAGDYAYVRQIIEGYNIADLGWGASNAKTVTFSFWVRSSVTGSFGISFRNSAASRTYITTYAINTANTWEYKTITVAGDTSGTWVTNNGRGLDIIFDLGVGSTYSASADSSWTAAASNYFGATGGTKLASTSGATFYITGVQLEVGSTATEFEHRLYGQELALCQRYYAKTYPIDVAPATNTGTSIAIGRSTDATSSYTTIAQWSYPVTMRATPSISLFNPVTGTANSFRADASNYSPSQTIFTSTCAVTVNAGGVSIGTSNYVSTHIVASAEL